MPLEWAQWEPMVRSERPEAAVDPFYDPHKRFMGLWRPPRQSKAVGS